MSEPVQKGEIDLKSLDQALNDGKAASEVPVETLQKTSNTLAQPAADAQTSAGNAASARKAPSPATLSPSSPRAMSPALGASLLPATDVPPAVSELKVMFPDLDRDTIAAVLSSRGGNQEAAINALLQMSDPNFKPSTTESRTDSDALLAQTIAMEEEQRQHEEWARRQQQQQQKQSSIGRGGGGAGSFFSGLLSSDARDPSTPSASSYDPNALTYQPRVRRNAPSNPAGAATAGARTTYAPPNHGSQTYENGDSLIPGMPGAKEAKQWQEEINRMAETGLAKAASTFSTFRQKASAAFNAPQDGPGQPGTAGTSGAGTSSAGAGLAQAFNNFRSSASRGFNTHEPPQQATATPTLQRQFTSPRSPHASEYDQDPSPVSENELAKIISRQGGAGGASSNPSAAGKARALAERYGLGIKNAGRGGVAASQNTSGSAHASDYAGWDQAGRTPISISDNTSGSKVSEPDKNQKNSIALMDSASGRGITSPRLDRSPTKETGSGGVTNKTAAAAGVAGAAAVGAGVGAITLASHDDNDLNDDSDDLEYVSNPFEDED